METETPSLQRIPRDIEAQNELRTEFGTKLGIVLPTNSELLEAAIQILKGKDGKEKWFDTLPVEVQEALQSALESSTNADELLEITATITNFCYEQAETFSEKVINSLFALIVINNARVWSVTNYAIVVHPGTLVVTQLELEDTESLDGYMRALASQRGIYRLFVEPLETIGKANFRGWDRYWHNSELSVIATNAALKVLAETGAIKNARFVRDLYKILSCKYYSVMYGREGLHTPARQEYQAMLFTKLQVDLFFSE